MYSIMLLNSFLGWFVMSIGGSFLGSKGCFYVLTYLGSLSFSFSVLAFYDVALVNNLMFSKYWYWFVLLDTYLDMGLLFDSLTVVMFLVVSSVSLLVYIYSLDYLAYDRHIASFFSYLSLFSFFMFILVASPSFLQMFMGWEGVGIASYLLINFWNTSLLANKAAFKAIIFNSMGDYFLSLSICLIQFYFGSVSYLVVFRLVRYISLFSSFILLLISGTLFMAVCGKSAQLGLHFWLPDAMEGPTRVSALIHAATMVTAGIYVLISSSPILEFCPIILILMAVMGGITALVCALIGLLQSDIKKVMAFSTCSQLGYMCLSCGLSLYDMALFHLFTHAIFKALLFLSAGAMMHSLEDDQSLLKYGSLIYWMPWTYICVFIGSLSLGGLRFLSGYYSKDTILELVSSNYFSWVIILWFLDTMVAGLTMVYSFKVMVLVFFSTRSYSFKLQKVGISDSSLLMSVVFVPLVLGSIFMGFLFQGMFLSEGSDFWGNSLYFNPLGLSNYLDFHWSFSFIKLLPSLFGILGMVVYICLAYFSLVNNKIYFVSVGSLLFSSFYLDVLINTFILYFIVFSNSVFYQVLDKGLLEIVGVIGSAGLFLGKSKLFKLFSLGHIYSTIMFMVLTLLVSFGVSTLI